MGNVMRFPFFPKSGSFGTPILSRFPKPPKGFGTGNRSGKRNRIGSDGNDEITFSGVHD